MLEGKKGREGEKWKPWLGQKVADDDDKTSERSN